MIMNRSLPHRYSKIYFYFLIFIISLISLTSVSSEELKGFFNKSGELEIESKWDYASSFDDSGFARIFNGTLSDWGWPKQGVYGYINKEGRLISEMKWADAKNFSNGLAAVKYKDKYGFIDTSGNIVIEPLWDCAYPFNDSGFALVFNGTLSDYGSPKTGKYGFITKEGVLVGDMKWDEASIFSNGLAAVKYKDKYGFIDTSGNIVIEPLWDCAYPFNDSGFALVFNGTLSDYGSPKTGKYGFISKEGVLIGDMKWDEAKDFSNGLAAVKYKDKYGFIDTSGNIVIEPLWDYAYSFNDSGFALVFNGTLNYGYPKTGKYGFISKEGVLIGDMKWDEAKDFSNGLAAVKYKDKYGFIDTSGNIVIEPLWDYAYSFNDSGFARFFNGTLSDYGSPKTGTFGFVNKAGESLGGQQWFDANDFNDGLACVKMNGKYGFIDTDGNLVVDYVFESKSVFQNGLTWNSLPGFDFKQASWGMNKENVISFEGEPEGQGNMTNLEADYIYYKRTLNGLDALLAYYFCDEGLYEARYIMQVNHSNESLYIDDYELIKKSIAKKFGEPLLDNEDWYNSSKKSYYSDDKGSALCYGYLTYSTLFSSSRTWVNMNMSADNYDITTTISFNSRDIEPAEKKHSPDF